MSASVGVLLEELSRTLGLRRSLVCLYGSQASRIVPAESDVDVMIAVETPDTGVFGRAHKLVTEHHRRHGWPAGRATYCCSRTPLTGCVSALLPAALGHDRLV